MKNVLKGSIFYVIIAIIVVLGINYIRGNLVENTGVTYSQFQKYVAQNKVSGVEVRQNSQGVTGELTLHLKDGEYRTLDVSDVTKAEDLLDQKNISYKVTVEKESVFMTTVLPMLLICVIFMVFFTMGSRQATGGNARMMNFGKSRATLTMPDNSKVTFKDVAGLQEEKEDLQEIVDFLKEPKKYLQVGARIPKGVLLVGPPGTGKTLLAKAVAGEAGVPFFSISGSDFVEMFVGVGASRVRDLFEQAKKNAPCIVFIDEIDAVGRKRGAGLGGGHDEREQTLNQLLVEMDGFADNAGIIILAATNRPDVLDPALLRPGRFDRQIVIGIPDIVGREEIFRIHSRNKPLDKSVDPKVLARRTPGFSPADIENMLNEAALLAARRNGMKIRMEEIEEAITKVIAGPEKKSRVISEEERKLTAYHEAGHAVVAHVLPKTDPVHQITIIPRGRAGGFTMILPKEDKYYGTKETMREQIIHLLGGRVAEMLTLDDISTGASNDIQRATDIAKEMVTKYGFSEKLGPVNYSSSDEVFLGKDFSTRQNYSEETASEIDEEVKSIIEEAYDAARAILKEHMEQLTAVAEGLLEVETLDHDQFVKLYDGVLTPKELAEELKKEMEKRRELDRKEAEQSARMRKREAERERRRLEEAAREMQEQTKTDKGGPAIMIYNDKDKTAEPLDAKLSKDDKLSPEDEDMEGRSVEDGDIYDDSYEDDDMPSEEELAVYDTDYLNAEDDDAGDGGTEDTGAEAGEEERADEEKREG